MIAAGAVVSATAHRIDQWQRVSVGISIATSMMLATLAAYFVQKQPRRSRGFIYTHEPYDTAQTPRLHSRHTAKAMKKERKVFDQDAVDVVKRAIGAVIDPLSEKKKVAIDPGSEGGLRRRNAKVKKIPAQKRKRTPLL